MAPRAADTLVNLSGDTDVREVSSSGSEGKAHMWEVSHHKNP